MKKTGAPSVFKEFRRFLKEEKGFDIKECSGFVAEDGLFMRSDTILQDIYFEFSRYIGVKTIENDYYNKLLQEKQENWENGCAMFFILPKDLGFIERKYQEDGSPMPKSYPDVVKIFGQINNQSICLGLDIFLIFIGEDDRIMEIRDNIFQILNEKYELPN